MGGLLAADVGGTKTDLGIFPTDDTSNAPLAEATLPTAQYPSLEAMVKGFIHRANLSVGHAIFGVAGPVVSGRARITNLPWVIDEKQLLERLNLSTAHLINDMEALAYSVPLLEPIDLRTLNEGEPDSKGTIAIIAPGTGLGEAFLTWDGSRYRAYASEGGHADFAPTNSVEIELLRYLQDRFEHVSYERVCSGRGLPNIYAFYHKDIGSDDERYLQGKEIANAEDPTPLIVSAALESKIRCELCAATLSTFVSILGAEAGNFALKVMSTSGIYLGGGISPRILPALTNGRFMQAFRRKGRMAELVSRMPVHVILNPRAALLGAARYGLDLLREGGGDS